MATLKNCPNCENELQEGAKFCSRCRQWIPGAPSDTPTSDLASPVQAELASAPISAPQGSAERAESSPTTPMGGGPNFCAHCGSGLSAAARFCPRCGEGVQTAAVSNRHVAAPPNLPLESQPIPDQVQHSSSASQRGGIPSAATTLPWVVAACAGFVVLGSFGDWVVYSFGQSTSGMESDGKFTLVLAVGALGAIFYRSKNLMLMRGAIISLILLALIAVVTIANSVDIQNKGTADLFGEQIQTAAPGWGLGIAFIASALGAVLGLILTVKDNTRISTLKAHSVGK